MNIVPWVRIIHWQVLPPCIFAFFHLASLCLYLLYLLLSSPYAILASEFVFALALTAIDWIIRMYYPTCNCLYTLFDIVWTGPVLLSMETVLGYVLVSWLLRVRAYYDFAPPCYLALTRAQLRHPAINIFIAGLSQRAVLLRKSSFLEPFVSWH